MGLWDWLTGKDLQARDYIPPIEAKAAPLGPAPIFLPNPIATGMLVHGPGANEAMRDAYGGGLYWNSIVYACITAICDGYVEAPLKLYQMGDDSKAKPIVNSPLERLYKRPNPYMTHIDLGRHINYGKHIHGNAYVRKLRAGNGAVTQLWPISPTVCWPVRERNSQNFIDYYIYQFGSGEEGRERIPVEDMIHFRMGIDDRDHKLGAAPVRAVLREILGDDNAAAFVDRILRNNAVPGLVVTVPVEAGDIGEANAQRIKDKLNATFSGENQGSTAVLTGGAKAEQFGFDPQQMDMRALRMTPEERICAALRVQPGFVGVGAGLERNTFSNSAEARLQFSENTILPLYQADDAVWSTQLLPEFTLDESMYVAHDITDMRALQPDENNKYTRLSLALGGKPFLSVNEARTDVGQPSMAGFDDIEEPQPAPEMAPAADDATAPTPIRAARSVKALNPRDFERVLRALAAGQEAPLEAALRTYQAGLQRRVLERLREGA